MGVESGVTWSKPMYRVSQKLDTGLLTLCLQPYEINFKLQIQFTHKLLWVNYYTGNLLVCGWEQVKLVQYEVYSDLECVCSPVLMLADAELCPEFLSSQFEVRFESSGKGLEAINIKACGPTGV